MKYPFTQRYLEQKARARTSSTKPSLTDQAGARETDVNVIVKNFTIHGQLPKGSTEPIYADFAQLPADLRGFIEMGRGLKQHQAKLPAALRQIPLQQLMAMNDQDIAAAIKPPAPPATTTESKQ